MGFFAKFLIFVLLIAILAATGLDLYILFLLNQTPVDSGKVRKFAGITGGYTIALAVIYVVALIIMSFTGATAKLLRHPKSLAFLVIFIILVIIVASLNFSILPVMKTFEEAGGSAAAVTGSTGTTGTSPQNTGSTGATNTANIAQESLARAKVLIIGSFSVGLGLIVLYLLFYAIKGLTSKKKAQERETAKEAIVKAAIPGVPKALI
jgi:hypothetical protein